MQNVCTRVLSDFKDNSCRQERRLKINIHVMWNIMWNKQSLRRLFGRSYGIIYCYDALLHDIELLCARNAKSQNIIRWITLGNYFLIFASCIIIHCNNIANVRKPCVKHYTEASPRVFIFQRLTVLHAAWGFDRKQTKRMGLLLLNILRV